MTSTGDADRAQGEDAPLLGRTGDVERAGEDEPFLGRPGDAAQEPGAHFFANFYLGTGILAQAGIWILVATVWASVFGNDLILFSAHPILNSTGLLFIVQAILVLQPTHTASQKATGTKIHALLHSIGLSSLLAGLIVIEYNKFGHNGTHFESVHAILGLTTYLFFLLQAFAGITTYWLPSLYGGVDNAKRLYKFHRFGGYVTLTLGLATVCAATQTGFNVMTLHIRLWAVAVASVLVVVGVVPRIKLQKLGVKA